MVPNIVRSIGIARCDDRPTVEIWVDVRMDVDLWLVKDVSVRSEMADCQCE